MARGTTSKPGAEVTIRPLRREDARAFWELRLRTFTDHPDAFGTTAQEWRSKSPEDAAAQFEDPRGVGNVVLGAFRGGRLVGHVGFDRDFRQKRRHKGRLFAMYVVPEERGRGIGARLVEALVAHARDRVRVSRLELTVMAHNTAALALYRRFGFTRFGLQQDALRWNGESYAEEHLELVFPPTAEG